MSTKTQANPTAPNSEILSAYEQSIQNAQTAEQKPTTPDHEPEQAASQQMA